jgi:transcriptional regulator with XRE-family HTH domain
MEPEPLGRMVRRFRLRADLTLEQLSEASGVSDRALSDIERGAARGPQHRTMLAILDALDLPDADRARMLRRAREGRRRARPSPAHHLPLPRVVPDFTGRSTELATLTAALTDRSGGRSPLVVVTGPAGYGKTSLAVQAASRLRVEFTEQVFVDLGGLAKVPPSPDAVATSLARALAGPGGPTEAGARQLRPGRPVDRSW